MPPGKFAVSVLVVSGEATRQTAAGRALRALNSGLAEARYNVVVAETEGDARAMLADASIQAALIDWDFSVGALAGERADEGTGARERHDAASRLLGAVRAKNAAMPVFLLAERTGASGIPLAALQEADDFIWLLEDTADFISGRIAAAIRRYQDQLLPPVLRALMSFSELHEYSWHTPGHTGGTGFLKSPVGRAFYEYFGENLFRSDLSVSVAELGSLLDHSGAIGAGEAYAAKVFGADRTYYVTNGTSTSNRVVVMAAVTQGEIALCDRNCHKSIEHSMTLTGATPVYLLPSRNHLGIIGPVHPERLEAAAIAGNIAGVVATAGLRKPALAVLTNSTYDGLCYDVAHVETVLDQSVDRILFDEAWFAYARFHPLYAGRYAMRERRDEEVGPTVFATQSTHKLLAALSQASMIHVHGGRRPISHERFNESFMIHASTSPQYAIIASNDVSAAMMDGPGGTALIQESVVEAIAFRKMMARIQAELVAKGEWFFGAWQPDTVVDERGTVIPFYQASEEFLSRQPAAWHLAPDAAWHGFGALPAGYCMLDPIKVSVVTCGLAKDGLPGAPGIPAQLVSLYLDRQGIIVEKTTDFTMLFLFSLGVTKGKWGTLINTLLDFKRDFDANAPLRHVLPGLVEKEPAHYGNMGLAELARAMFASMQRLQFGSRLEAAFSGLPEAVHTPAEAYRRLVLGDVEPVALAAMGGRILATGIVPYPPGIPLLMPGEAAGDVDGAALRYLSALEAFDREFPEFSHDIHGVEARGGVYHAMCLTTPRVERAGGYF